MSLISLQAGILLGSTVVLSALWAAVLFVLVRLREVRRGGGRGHLGVELAWVMIPALTVLLVVTPALLTDRGDGGGSLEGRVAEAPPAAR